MADDTGEDPRKLISEIRGRSKELREELRPLTKDATHPMGLPQKVARRSIEGLELFEKLCDLVEKQVLPKLR